MANKDSKSIERAYRLILEKYDKAPSGGMFDTTEAIYDILKKHFQNNPSMDSYIHAVNDLKDLGIELDDHTFEQFKIAMSYSKIDDNPWDASEIDLDEIFNRLHGSLESMGGDLRDPTGQDRDF